MPEPATPEAPRVERTPAGERPNREIVVKAFDGALELFEREDGKTPQQEWAFEAMSAARGKTIDKGQTKFKNTFKEEGTDRTYTQYEGIPVDDLLLFLTEKIESGTLSKNQTKRLKWMRTTIAGSSRVYYEGLRTEHYRHHARLQQEANHIHNDPRATGSSEGDWELAESELITRLELIVPTKSRSIEPGPVPEPVAEPDNNPQEETPPETPPTPEPAPEPEVPPAPPYPGDPPEIPPAPPYPGPPVEVPPAPPYPPLTPETPPAPPPDPNPLPQYPGGPGPISEYQAVVANRTADPMKRAREMAEQQLQAVLRGEFGRRKRIWYRLTEEYHRQVFTQRAFNAIIENGNSFLTMDLVRNEITDANKVHDINAEREAGAAVVQRVKEGGLMEGNDERGWRGEEAADADVFLKNILVRDVIRPMVLRSLDSSSIPVGGRAPVRPPQLEEIQEGLRQFVIDQQDNQVVEQIFGKDATDYNKLADYFATDLLDTVNQIATDIRWGIYSLDQIDQHLQIKFARTEWAREGRMTFGKGRRSFTDWLVQKAQGADSKAILFKKIKERRGFRESKLRSIRGAVLNPATIGAAVSIGSLAIFRLPSLGMRAAAHVASPIAGAFSGGVFAAFRRNYESKVDRAMHQMEVSAYGGEIPDGARRREKMQRYSYKTATVNDLLNGNAADQEQGIEARRSMQDLLSSDLSQQENQTALVERIAEIRARLDYSAGENVDLITYEGKTQVEQGRLQLTRAAAEGRRALGMTDAEEAILEAAIQGQVNERIGSFTQDRRVKDRAFKRFKLRRSVYAGFGGAAIGGSVGILAQEGIALGQRAFGGGAGTTALEYAFGARDNKTMANPEALRNLLQGHEQTFKFNLDPQGKIIVEGQVSDELKRQIHEAGYEVARGQPIHHENILIKPQNTVENTQTGHATVIPEGTEWIKDPSNPDSWDLVVKGHPDQVLMDNAQFDSNGHITHFDYQNDAISIQESGSKSGSGGATTEVITGEKAMKSWREMGTKIDHMEWYGYNTKVSDYNELRAYTYKNGDTLTLDMSKMTIGRESGLVPDPIDVRNIIQNHESGFAFSLPGHTDAPVWIQDGADGKWDGLLHLDPNSTELLTRVDGSPLMVNGHQMTLGEFSKTVVNQEALQKLQDGDIATELYNHRDVFNLGHNGDLGYWQAGRMVNHDGKLVFQSFATGRGSGGVQMHYLGSGSGSGAGDYQTTIDLQKEIKISGETPTYKLTPVESEVKGAPPIISTPMWPRRPLESLDAEAQAVVPAPAAPSQPVPPPPVPPAPATTTAPTPGATEVMPEDDEEIIPPPPPIPVPNEAIATTPEIPAPPMPPATPETYTFAGWTLQKGSTFESDDNRYEVLDITERRGRKVLHTRRIFKGGGQTPATQNFGEERLMEYISEGRVHQTSPSTSPTPPPPPPVEPIEPVSPEIPPVPPAPLPPATAQATAPTPPPASPTAVNIDIPVPPSTTPIPPPPATPTPAETGELDLDLPLDLSPPLPPDGAPYGRVIPTPPPATAESTISLETGTVKERLKTLLTSGKTNEQFDLSGADTVSVVSQFLAGEGLRLDDASAFFSSIHGSQLSGTIIGRGGETRFEIGLSDGPGGNLIITPYHVQSKGMHKLVNKKIRAALGSSELNNSIKNRINAQIDDPSWEVSGFKIEEGALKVFFRKKDQTLGRKVSSQDLRTPGLKPLGRRVSHEELRTPGLEPLIHERDIIGELQESKHGMPGVVEREIPNKIGADTFASADHPEENQDSNIFNLVKGFIGVFDGMGGEKGGAVASNIAAKYFNIELSKLPANPTREQILEAFRLTREATLEEFKSAIAKDQSLKRMGTTATVVQTFTENNVRQAAILQAGDSRAYVYRRDGTLQKLTADQSALETERMAGRISEEDAKIIDSLLDNMTQRIPDSEKNAGRANLYFAHRNILDKTFDRNEPEIQFYTLQPDDLYIFVTSDGVHDNLTTKQIEEACKTAFDAYNLAGQLVVKARDVAEIKGNIRSKMDDITAVAIDVES